MRSAILVKSVEPGLCRISLIENKARLPRVASGRCKPGRHSRLYPMRKAVWPEAIQSSADAERAEHYYRQLQGTDAASLLRSASVEQARILAAVFSGSRALSEWLIANPKLLSELEPGRLESPRQLQGLWREVNEWL